MALSSLFVLCPQLGQDLLVAGLPAGDPVKVAAGRFADRHALSGKGSADVAEIAFALRGRSIFLGNHFSHLLTPPPIKQYYISSFQISFGCILSIILMGLSQYIIAFVAG